MTHREQIKAWLAGITLWDQTVHDWGSGSKPVSRYVQHDNVRFITLDKNPLIAEDRRSKDHITADLTEPIHLDPADTAFCIEVLEHTLYPQELLENISNNLKPEGSLYLTMPYDFPVHSDDDYLRLTENGLRAHLQIAGFIIDKLEYTSDRQGYIVEAHK